MKIGLIGLGIMGKPMAKNLLKAGYDLTVSDLNQASVDEIVAAGAKAATNAEIGETCDVVLTMGAPLFRAKKPLPLLVLIGSFLAVYALDVNIMLVILVCAGIGALEMLWKKKQQGKEAK